MQLIQRSMSHYRLLSFLGVLTALLLCLPTSVDAAPNVCTIQNPAEGAEVLPWLEPRPGGRQHLGVDIMLPTCTLVSNQLGCDIVMNGSTPLFSSKPPTKSYGYYTKYRCNEWTSVRYTHLHGYDADKQMVINGYSGAALESSPHIHYEVYVDAGSGPRAMDPECVWGTKGPSTCCIGVSGTCLLGNGPADLCNATVRQQLDQNHNARVTGGAANSPPNGYTSENPLREGVDPFQVPPGIHWGEGVPRCDGSMPIAEPTRTPGTPTTTEIENEEEGTFTPETTYPGSTVTFPPDPLGTEPSGTRGPPAAIPPLGPTGTGDPTSACSTDVWIAMVNKSVLEARRESVVNQRMIAKADSVLTYSCFDTLTKNTGIHAGPIFSETDFWAGKTIDILGKTVTVNVTMGASSLDGSIALVVDQAAASYLSSNFNHGLLGETVPVTASAPSATSCNVMAAVWQAAKCRNLNTPFYSFTDLLGTDPREFPSGGDYACTGY